MLKVVTVCGNGIGSSLMLKMKIEVIAKENGIEVSVEPSDSNGATGKDCDLFVLFSKFNRFVSIGENLAAVEVELVILFIQPTPDNVAVFSSVFQNFFKTFVIEAVLGFKVSNYYTLLDFF